MKRIAILLTALTLPAAALAGSWEPQWGTNNRGTSNYQYYQRDLAIHRDGVSWHESDGDRDRERYWRGKHCPPGLAKKHNGCMPPGQAKKR